MSGFRSKIPAEPCIRPGNGALPVLGRERSVRSALSPSERADSEAFEGFIVLVYPIAVRRGLGKCDRQEVDDFIQETFLKLWSNWVKYEDDKVWNVGYFLASLNNVVKDARRKKAPKTCEEVEVETFPNAEGGAGGEILDDRTRHLLARLTERQRHVITEIVFHGKKPCDVAEALGLDRKTVYCAKQAALRKLKRIISE